MFGMANELNNTLKDWKWFTQYDLEFKKIISLYIKFFFGNPNKDKSNLRNQMSKMINQCVKFNTIKKKEVGYYPTNIIFKYI